MTGYAFDYANIQQFYFAKHRVLPSIFSKPVLKKKGLDGLQTTLFCLITSHHRRLPPREPPFSAWLVAVFRLVGCPLGKRKRNRWKVLSQSLHPFQNPLPKERILYLISVRINHIAVFLQTLQGTVNRTRSIFTRLQRLA